MPVGQAPALRELSRERQSAARPPLRQPGPALQQWWGIIRTILASPMAREPMQGRQGQSELRALALQPVTALRLSSDARASMGQPALRPARERPAYRRKAFAAR